MDVHPGIAVLSVRLAALLQRYGDGGLGANGVMPVARDPPRGTR